MRSAPKLESAESTRQTAMLLIAAYIPTPSASSSAIDSSCHPWRAHRVAPTGPRTALGAGATRLTTANL